MIAPLAERTNGACRRICVTPVRNEAWIIDKFLAAAKTWATDVIVADQGSTDGTLQRLQDTPDVSVVINDSPVFDEAHRQQLLLAKARHIPGPRVLIGLDADEALSANCTETDDWRKMHAAPPGTVLKFPWVNILPGFTHAWVPDNHIECGFIDDGSEHHARAIHSPRVPRPANAPVLEIKEFVVLHFQYVVWSRMRSKHRWYQVWERLNNFGDRPLDIFRMYNHMRGGWGAGEIQPVRPEWFEAYERAGLEFRSLKSEAVTWWDREVVRILLEHGTEMFSRLDVWDQDWNEIARSSGLAGSDLSDPRSTTAKMIHRVLAATQAHRSSSAVRAFERCLRMSGW